eukprot:TRINITY_DN1318_c0_g1_i2.p1 TRINITY_DN1318_c0_g1~~TRINITY_DN1318_c0_g1_i2.p1  ORF type:complete len:773 (+),score=76.87 TRINITY_DN1318_c0_g1_i2:2349-4667(+)
MVQLIVANAGSGLSQAARSATTVTNIIPLGLIFCAHPMSSPSKKKMRPNGIMFVTVVALLAAWLSPDPAFATMSWTMELGSVTPYPRKVTDGPAPDPGSRTAPSTFFDAAGGKMYLFGGYDNTGTSTPYQNDLWVLDFTSKNWTLILEPPPYNSSFPEPQSLGALVLDAESRLWLLGGDKGAGPSMDVWYFDLINSVWVAVSVAGPSPTPSRIFAVFDNSTNSIWGFRRSNGPSNKQSWKLSLSTLTWTLFDYSASPSYPGGDFSAVSFDTNTGSVWAMAGAEVWRLNISSGIWQLQSPCPGAQKPIFGEPNISSFESSPGSREYPCISVDSTKRRLYLFGGATSIGSENGYVDDLWIFDLDIGFWTFVSGTKQLNLPGSFNTSSGGIVRPGGLILHSCFLYYDAFYVYGGYNWFNLGLNNLWKFNARGLENPPRPDANSLYNFFNCDYPMAPTLGFNATLAFSVQNVTLSPRCVRVPRLAVVNWQSSDSSNGQLAPWRLPDQSYFPSYSPIPNTNVGSQVVSASFPLSGVYPYTLAGMAGVIYVDPINVTLLQSVLAYRCDYCATTTPNEVTISFNQSRLTTTGCPQILPGESITFMSREPFSFYVISPGVPGNVTPANNPIPQLEDAATQGTVTFPFPGVFPWYSESFPSLRGAVYVAGVYECIAPPPVEAVPIFNPLNPAAPPTSASPPVEAVPIFNPLNPAAPPTRAPNATAVPSGGSVVDSNGGLPVGAIAAIAALAALAAIASVAVIVFRVKKKRRFTYDDRVWSP